jgi:hypothetical protein
MKNEEKVRDSSRRLLQNKLIAAAGETVGGANVESASCGLACRAERVALFKALTDGRKKFAAVAVVARAGSRRPNTRRTRRCSSRTAMI